MAEKTGNITVRTEKLMLPELRSLNDNGVPLLTVRRLVIFPHVLVPLMLAPAFFALPPLNSEVGFISSRTPVKFL